MNLIDEISFYASKHKLIPFLGAGCSIPHLKMDWNGIFNEMKNHINSDKSTNIEIAQDYVNKKGRKDFCDFLKKHFHIDEFIDEKGYSHLVVMTLGLKIVYTTNQDNIFEKCNEKYGRTYKKIITLDDLAESMPGDNLYFKFHGDLENEASIVFTEDDYNNRMSDKNYFLDIRLKSDLLGKRFLFIGYSFRDDNIKKIFSELQDIFDGKIPDSYLIAYSRNEELDKVCGIYNIKVINPTDYFKDCNENEAYELLLSQLSKDTFSKKSFEEIKNLFTPSIPHSMFTVSNIELKNLENIPLSNNSNEEDINEYIKKFRGLLDRSFIPRDFESKVLEIFINLCNKCSGKEYPNLQGICFNISITQPVNQLEFLAYTLLVFNRYSKIKHLSPMSFEYRPRLNNMDSLLEPIAYARAIEIIKENKIDCDNSFKEIFSAWSSRFDLSNEFYDRIRNYIYSQYQILYGKSGLTNPLNRDITFFTGRNYSYNDILKSLIPLTIKPPYED